jgi:hypothetical protein
MSVEVIDPRLVELFEVDVAEDAEDELRPDLLFALQ